VPLAVVRTIEFHPNSGRYLMNLSVRYTATAPAGGKKYAITSTCFTA
jgi:hypothetical protein